MLINFLRRKRRIPKREVALAKIIADFDFITWRRRA